MTATPAPIPDMSQHGEDNNAPNRFSTIYFGYASNLSPRTMKQRCPDSAYAGLAVLRDWKWIINSTGYATIIPSPGDIVYGGLHFLSARDEAALDHSEGVPWLYEKVNVPVHRFSGEKDWVETTAQKVTATTYVDTQRMTEGAIEGDYIVWINRAIFDATREGMPQEYVDKYLRRFVGAAPAEDMEITMVRTTMKPGMGSLLDQEAGSAGVKVPAGFMMGASGGRVRDGSTA